jgi:nitrous oxidase accessory protein
MIFRLLPALVIFAGQVAWPALLEVGPGRQFAAVSEALARAAAGDTIRVAPGLYPGRLTIRVPVTLEGNGGRPVLRGDGSLSVITVLADGCVIRGLTIENSGGDLAREDSGVLLKSSHNIIERNELRDVLFGIYFYHSDDNFVRGNTIRGRPQLGLGERGSGIHVWNSSGNRIEDNAITQTRDGMYLQQAYHSLIRGNRAYELRYGLHYMFSDDNVFEDNRFYRNVAGAAIMYSKRIRFRRNTFVQNRGFSSFGILFQDSEACVAEQNTISDNAVGIFMESLRGSTLRGNLIASNDVALQVFTSASRNRFERNNFIENLSPIQVIGGQTDNDWSGNYWSDYQGYDLDGDGAGDVPHPLQNAFEHLEANHPRLRVYLFSPASQALAFAERNFPVIQRPQELDQRPLMRALETGAPAADLAPRAGGRGWAALPGALAALAALAMVKGRRR